MIKLKKDYLQIITAFDNTIRIYLINSTNLVNKASKTKMMYPTAIAALGRTLSVTLMMGQMLKGDQTIAVKVEGDGPLGKIVTEADTSGNVMGYVQNGEVYLKYNDHKLNVGDAVGRNGFITVVKDLHLKEPFVSSTPIISGELAEDFTYYFTVSEQVPSSVSLGVLVSNENEVISAGGFIVQVMPNCKDETIDLLMKKLQDVKPVSELILENNNLEEIAKLIIGDDVKYEILKTIDVDYKCRCSKETFRKGLKSLGKDTLLKMYKEDHQIETTCQYCGKKYLFDEEELKKILDEIKS